MRKLSAIHLRTSCGSTGNDSRHLSGSRTERLGMPPFWPERNFNAAVFDSVMIGLAHRLDRSAVISKGIAAAYRTFMSDTDYREKCPGRRRIFGVCDGSRSMRLLPLSEKCDDHAGTNPAQGSRSSRRGQGRDLGHDAELLGHWGRYSCVLCAGFLGMPCVFCMLNTLVRSSRRTSQDTSRVACADSKIQKASDLSKWRLRLTQYWESP